MSDPTWLADDDAGADGVTRVIAALDAVDPDDCPVRTTHHKMIDTCAICGQEPRAKLELGSLANRPGGTSWEIRVMEAVLIAAECRIEMTAANHAQDYQAANVAMIDAAKYTQEVERLVRMAEKHAS